MHEIQLLSDVEPGNNRLLKHIFAYVIWKKLHPQQHHFGASSIVCADTYELHGVSCFLLVQRISCRAAHAVMHIKFEHASECVFVACPLPVVYHL